MSKREHGQTTEVGEGSLPKRRKEAPGEESSDVDITMTESIGPVVNGNGRGGSGSEETTKAQGLRLWQIVKDAVNKE